MENIQTLTKTTRVTALNWADDKNKLLIGRIEPVVKVYSTTSNAFIDKQTFEKGPIVGLAKFNGKLIAGLANGKIQIIGNKKSEFLDAGDSMSRFRQCNHDLKLVATGGKERQNNLKVWNLETNECTFKTKNIPNDFLQLEVPIWDTDFGFINENCLSTCSRYGYVRVYDMRTQRRPTLNYSNDKEQISYTCLALHDNIIFSGTTTGILHAFDLRKMKHILHTYKGFSGSISDICVDNTGNYICSASLDRFVRVHATASTILQYQCYVKSKATRILLKECAPKVEIKSEDDDDATDSDDEDIDDAVKHSNSQPDDDDDTDFDELFDQMPTVE